MIFGRSPALIISLFGAFVNLVVFGVTFWGHVIVPVEFVALVNGFFIALVAAVANQEQTGTYFGARKG